jgi:hypothetical protein
MRIILASIGLAARARGLWAALARVPLGRGRLASVLAAWLAVAMVCDRTHALEIDFTSRAVNRTVIALYDARKEAVLHETRLHRFAEMPLNHLGYRLVYHDINAPLPDPQGLAGAAAVVTWLLEPMAAPQVVADWLDRVTGAGTRLVVLGEIVPEAPEALRPVISRILARIGLASDGAYVERTVGATVERLDTSMLGFERPVDKVLPPFPLVEALPGRVEAHLAIRVPERGSSRRAAVVATGSGGGFAAQSFTTYYEPTTDRVVWVLNPFLFFRKALGDQVLPVPDVTTLVGRRVYFSHIDGDGWNNLSEVEGYRGAGALSAEVIAAEAIERYPDLPVTVGLIGCDVLPGFGANPAGQRTARRLFALPQVEVASHTHTHPYDWSFFERYDRQGELDAVERANRPARPWRERLKVSLAALAGRPAPADGFDKYVAGSDDLPRTYLRQPFVLAEEVAGALALAESYAPAGKKAKLYQWSGDTTPFEAAVRATREAGVANINGGDSRLDASYPSVAYVPPISRPVGSERQIYAGNSNENTYTNDWTGPYHGLLQLQATLDNTDRPRRLKPFNLYYHMYSGEKSASLAAVRHFLDLARDGAVVPITTSHYARMASDFFGVEIRQTGLQAWEIERRGLVQTVRFDDADHLALDIAASPGVLGATRSGSALYISLDPAVARPRVALVPRGATEGSTGSDRFQLVESRWLVEGVEHAPCGLRARVEGFGPGDMVWRVPPGRRFSVELSRDGATIERLAVASDDLGHLRVRLAPVSGAVTLGVACHG